MAYNDSAYVYQGLIEMWILVLIELLMTKYEVSSPFA